MWVRPKSRQEAVLNEVGQLRPGLSGRHRADKAETTGGAFKRTAVSVLGAYDCVDEFV